MKDLMENKSKAHSPYRAEKLRELESLGREEISKYWYYALISSAAVLALSTVGFLNGYFRFINATAYYNYERVVLLPIGKTGYFTMFLIICFFPVSDYVLIPFYGYLSSLGYFNVYTTFFVILGSLMFIAEIEYFGGRFAGRSLLLKALSYFKIGEKELQVADKWLENHGQFSIFISTFIPYFRNVTSLAAGTLRMNSVYYFIVNLVGYLIRTLILLYLGYAGLDALTPSFDYNYRLPLFISAIIASLVLALTVLNIISQHKGRVKSISASR
ncbi:MAG: DedA family protein [Conexivisphaerales archaeon]